MFHLFTYIVQKNIWLVYINAKHTLLEVSCIFTLYISGIYCLQLWKFCILAPFNCEV